MNSGNAAPSGHPLAAAAALWRLAARVFAAEIDPSVYRGLLAISARADDPALALVDAGTRMRPESDVLDDLAVEYCRLFIGPRAACPPYGSVHGGEACLGGQARRRILELMDEYGLAVTWPADMPVLSEDHIAVALTLLDHLYGRAARGMAGAAGAACELRESWLLPWAPRFLETVRGESPDSLYGTVARLTDALIRDEGLLAWPR